jgi:hypothetical protein
MFLPQGQIEVVAPSQDNAAIDQGAIAVQEQGEVERAHNREAAAVD